MSRVAAKDLNIGDLVEDSSGTFFLVCEINESTNTFNLMEIDSFDIIPRNDYLLKTDKLYKLKD